MHNAGYQELGLPFSYIAFDTEDTKGALSAMRTLKIRGYSLTIPHKEAAVALLDELSPEAKIIGAVNTVLNSGTKLFGENTDWIGVQAALKEAEVEAKGQRVLIFGAGGAARAGIFALQKMGASEIVVCNRTLSRAQDLANEFSARAIGEDELSNQNPKDYALLVNTTPLGSHLQAGANPLACFYVDGENQHLPAYFEMGTFPTPLLKLVQSLGAKAIEGQRMLLFQAEEQFRLFTEQSAPLKAMEAALISELSQIKK